MALNTFPISDLEVVVERRVCPCTKIEILLKCHRDCMLVPVPISVVPVPKVYWYSTALGTSILGTSTTASLHVGTGTSMCGTGTTASVTAPLHYSTTRGLSTAVVINSDDLHLFSRIKPLQKMCPGLEKPAHA